MATETTTDLFSDSGKTNIPEMGVGELALSLKKTLEETFGRVRVRGELSGLKLAASGHLYGDIKDEEAVINIVCWRGSVSRLSVKPEDGLEVVITGKVSSYPKSSRYQIIVDSMELAGEGALLKMLEDRKKKLAAEGLFDAARKKPLPFLPETIGVVTSPTGAVIRDIIHRIEDRFPRPVLLWPAAVQGEKAAAEIAAAIRGFNALPVPPDILIVARGGGSLEDLMAFNEEEVVRAVAESDIPVISAVGHETDTTLIDYAADLRAPTPTGAAEMAVPVRIDLMAQVREDQGKMIRAMQRHLSDLKNILETGAVRLGDPQRLLEIKIQNLDFLSGNLQSRFEKILQQRKSNLKETAAKLLHPRARLEGMGKILMLHTEALYRSRGALLKEPQSHLDQAARMLESLSFKRVLERGFTVLRDSNGALVTRADQTREGMGGEIEFSGGEKVGITLGKRLKP
ncbi:MAG: exodeoxyribonuclease VII large subunit [Rhodospirillales bacterium]|nr:exodeoxyribonuclease VII large subunit [Alphaproteobacteria bacterium]USO04234.1 MAG: exodeoxyribonuclease VII large subunit [Rhodospirillales bacterium]